MPNSILVTFLDVLTRSLTRLAKVSPVPACWIQLHLGTFSSVYIAQDLEHYKYDNSRWCKFHVKSNEPKNATCGKVALKRIYATSSAARIHSELNLLKQLR